MTDTAKDAPQNAVITECDLPDAPERVWRALTVPELLARWLPDAVGCEILAAEPNRLLRYRWRAAEDDRDSFVTFERESQGGVRATSSPCWPRPPS
jgi:uncharacterized protein YndB with AHSA1/START domain